MIGARPVVIPMLRKTWAAIMVTLVALAAIIAGRARYRWLADGAPQVADSGI